MVMWTAKYLVIFLIFFFLYFLFYGCLINHFTKTFVALQSKEIEICIIKIIECAALVFFFKGNMIYLYNKSNDWGTGMNNFSFLVH